LEGQEGEVEKMSDLAKMYVMIAKAQILGRDIVKGDYNPMENA